MAACGEDPALEVKYLAGDVKLTPEQEAQYAYKDFPHE